MEEAASRRFGRRPSLALGPRGDNSRFTGSLGLLQRVLAPPEPCSLLELRVQVGDASLVLHRPWLLARTGGRVGWHRAHGLGAGPGSAATLSSSVPSVLCVSSPPRPYLVGVLPPFLTSWGCYPPFLTSRGCHPPFLTSWGCWEDCKVRCYVQSIWFSWGLTYGGMMSYCHRSYYLI